MAPDCPDREKTPRNEWHMHEAVSAHQNDDQKAEDNSNDKETLSEKKVKWLVTTWRQFFQRIEPDKKNKEERICTPQVR